MVNVKMYNNNYTYIKIDRGDIFVFICVEDTRCSFVTSK